MQISKRCSMLLVLASVFSTGLLTKPLQAQSPQDENLEFLEFLSMEMISPDQEAKDKLAEFANKLAIRKEQQPAWNAFVENVLNDMNLKAERQRARQQKMRQRNTPITAVEMVEAHIENLNQQLSDAQKNHQIIGDLEATLDESQRNLFDHAMRMIIMKKLQRFKN